LIVPLSIAAPAAVAGLKYLDARLGLTYDYRLIGSAFKAQFRLALKEKKDRLNFFYVLEDHAKGKQANEILLIFGGRQWTYKEVYEIALKYGTWLKTKYNVKPKEIVAMDFMNSEKFVFIWLGIWAIGGKPAFINYNLTGKALAHCIRVSTSRLAFVDPEVADHVTQDVRDELSAVQFEIFTPELEADVMSTEGIREPDAVRTDDKPQNMAVLIYTSGTTGLPKGAIVSWTKIHVGTGFIPPWMGFTKKDIFYTVSWCLRAFSSLTLSSACPCIILRPASSVSATLSTMVRRFLSARSSPQRRSGKIAVPQMPPSSNMLAKHVVTSSPHHLNSTQRQAKTST
jgi:acyl-CoA synthetase (AMP-forming)/AMP-acid ligase II